MFIELIKEFVKKNLHFIFIEGILILLVIIFFNTGIGFFHNLMIFIFSLILATPISIVLYKLTTIFSEKISYHIGAFVLGSLIGVAIVVRIFTNPLEINFINQCVQTNGYSNKNRCECTFSYLKEKYNNDELKKILFARYPNSDKIFDEAWRKCK